MSKLHRATRGSLTAKPVAAAGPGDDPKAEGPVRPAGTAQEAAGTEARGTEETEAWCHTDRCDGLVLYRLVVSHVRLPGLCRRNEQICRRPWSSESVNRKVYENHRCPRLGTYLSVRLGDVQRHGQQSTRPTATKDSMELDS